MLLNDYRPDAFDVRVAELLTATADGADSAIDDAVPEVLRLLRDKLRMDVVFVSEFVDDQRVFRWVDQAPGAEAVAANDAGPLEESWCQRVVDGRLPEFIADARPLVASGAAPRSAMPVGTHISTPLKLPDGRVYGTLCAFSFAPDPAAREVGLQRLRYTAQLAGQRIGQTAGFDVESGCSQRPCWVCSY